MNIIDMSFEQLVDLFEEDKYWNRFMPMMEKYVRSNIELHFISMKLLDLLANHQDKNPDTFFESFDIAIQKHPELSDGYMVLDDDNESLFSIIHYTYVHIFLYFYLKRQYMMLMDTGHLDSAEMKRMKNAMDLLYKLLEKNELLSIVYILAFIDYEANNCQNKPIKDLTPDQCLVYAQMNMTDLKQADDIIEALIEINPKNPEIICEKREVLAKLFYEKEEYSRVLNQTSKLTRANAKEGIERKSYAMLGNVDEFFLHLKGLELDEQEIHCLLFMLALNADPGAYGGTYQSLVSYIKKKYSEMNCKDFTVHSISERRIETRDENHFYILFFKYITDWILNYKEFKTSLSMDPNLSESSVFNPMSKYAVFDLLDDDIEKDIKDLVGNEKIYDDRCLCGFYEKYYDRLYDCFPEDLCDFQKYFYQLGLGSHVYEKTRKLVSDAKIANDKILRNKLAFLLTTAYIDAHKNKNYEANDFFKQLFQKYDIDPNNVSNDLLRTNIYDSLSETGKYEYKSACLLYDSIKDTNYRNNDAGMLSMAFYRIIENESNSRIWEPVSLLLDYDEIQRIENAHLDTLTSRPKKDFKFRWDNNLKTLKKLADAQRNGTLQDTVKLMLGSLRVLIESLHETDPLANYVRGFFFQQLTPYGQSEFYNNTFDEWYSKDKVDSFRNPPAHNRYLHLETALKSKEYVEEQLLKMADMFIR